jgi:urea carboxylase
MFKRVLIANRGEIACRILKSLDRLEIESVAVYADPDRYAPHVLGAGQAVRLGPAPAAESYLQGERIIAAALETGAEAIHPGYGFLSENPDFAEACARAGLVFIGPTAEQMRLFGLKHTARAQAEKVGVPLAPGSSLLSDRDQALAEGRRIGFPLMIKSTAGGGGIGLQLCRSESEFDLLFDRALRLARHNFSNDGLFLEKYIEQGRHIEAQIFGDGKGRVVALGERDCSAQRRNQKVIEETPAPHLSDDVRAELLDTACRLMASIGYQSAGTVEFIYDAATAKFYFLEVNTRLQVEHCVTEEVTGIDLVEWMIRQAAGETLPFESVRCQGAAIEVRLYAENPARDFRPSSGLITHLRFGEGARIESWIEAGSEVTPFYDPLLAKIVVKGADRCAARETLRAVLAATEIGGIETNLSFLSALADSPLFAAGRITTRSLDSFAFASQTLEILSPGTQTTIQDYPGRQGHWAVGVPPSGPIDDLSFRLANRALGNAADAAGLEITLAGPVLKFNVSRRVCLTGAELLAELDGRKAPFWQPFTVPAGGVLSLGGLTGPGCRAYLAVEGGIAVPSFLGSRATFTLGKFGGHGGRALQAGDFLPLGPAHQHLASPVPAALRPSLGHYWRIGVLDGPHGAPDFFTESDIEAFFAADWEVHYNFNRTGIRLIGPKPAWARKDGGEAGLHPSNIHDNAYAIGAVDFTGDMPVILGPDGPSLGGFVCPVTIVKAQRWKLGQLRAGDKIRFVRLSAEDAAAAEQAIERSIATLAPPPAARLLSLPPQSPILGETAAAPGRPRVVYRRAGDHYLLVEYGPLALDLELRFRVHALMLWLERQKIGGIIDITPGIRSLQIHYDPKRLALNRLLARLEEAERALADLESLELSTRIVHLPLSWDDAATRLAIEKYQQSVRKDAPWCPSNIEFIRRINGLQTIEEVKKIVYQASYLVLGLGDVYLGAPVATPLDPRHRLVTTKYNPARTWTPENAVGIGGAYLCIYGMEGPGGYQFVGRTCQMWNSYRRTAEFTQPWLLRFFDQIRFYELSGPELLRFRTDFLHGEAHLRIEEERFRLADYRRFLAENAPSIAEAKARQQAAFDAERAIWEATGQIGYEAELPEAEEDFSDSGIPEGHHAVASPVSGSVWKIAVSLGQQVAEGELLMVIESMKMEISITAPGPGQVAELRCSERKAVSAGQTLILLARTETIHAA